MVGICAEIRVPPPIGLTIVDRPVERRQAVGETTQAAAGPRVGAADAVVVDLDASGRSSSLRTRTSPWSPSAYFVTLARASEMTK